MEKSNKDEPEEKVELQDLAVQEEDSESLQSDKQLQKREGKLMQKEPVQEVKTLYSLLKSEENESTLKRRRKVAADGESELDTDGSKVVQEKYEGSFALGQDSTQTNQSYAIRKECRVFSEDKLLESYGNSAAQRTEEAPESILSHLDIQVTRQDDAICQGYDRSESLKPKLEASLTKQLRERTLEESSIALMEDLTMGGRSLKPKSEANLTEQLREKTEESSVTLMEDSTIDRRSLKPFLTYQLDERPLEESSVVLMEDPIMGGRSLKPKLEANSIKQLRERTLEESSVGLMEDPTMGGRSLKPLFTDQRERTAGEISIAILEALKAEQEANGGFQQEYDRTSENDADSQERESDQESENSQHECFLTRQTEEELSSPLQSRICYHRNHARRQRLPPVIEVPDEPLDPFEVEIALNRYTRAMYALPPRGAGFLNYLRRFGEYHIPPERRDRYAELHRRLVKFFCSIVIGVIFIVAMVLILNYLEDKYGNQVDSNVTSTDDFGDDLSTAATGFKTDTSVICLETDGTTPVVYSINFRADFDTEVTPALNGVDSTSTNPVKDLE